MPNIFDDIPNGELFQKKQIELLAGIDELDYTTLEKSVFRIVSHPYGRQYKTRLLAPAELELEQELKENILEDILNRSKWGFQSTDYFVDCFITNDGKLMFDVTDFIGWLGNRFMSIHGFLSLSDNIPEYYETVDDNIKKVFLANEKFIALTDSERLLFPAALQHFFGLGDINLIQGELETDGGLLKKFRSLPETNNLITHKERLRHEVKLGFGCYNHLLASNMLKQIKGESYEHELPYINEILTEPEFKEKEYQQLKKLLIVETDSRLTKTYQAIGNKFQYWVEVVKNEPEAGKQLAADMIDYVIGLGHTDSNSFKTMHLMTSEMPDCTNVLKKAYSFYKTIESLAQSN